MAGRTWTWKRLDLIAYGPEVLLMCAVPDWRKPSEWWVDNVSTLVLLLVALQRRLIITLLFIETKYAMHRCRKLRIQHPVPFRVSSKVVHRPDIIVLLLIRYYIELLSSNIIVDIENRMSRLMSTRSNYVNPKYISFIGVQFSFFFPRIYLSTWDVSGGD